MPGQVRGNRVGDPSSNPRWRALCRFVRSLYTPQQNNSATTSFPALLCAVPKPGTCDWVCACVCACVCVSRLG